MNFKSVVGDMKGFLTECVEKSKPQKTLKEIMERLVKFMKKNVDKFREEAKNAFGLNKEEKNDKNEGGEIE